MDSSANAKVPTVLNGLNEFKKSNQAIDDLKASKKKYKESKLIKSLASRPKWIWIILIVIIFCALLGAIGVSLASALYNPIRADTAQSYPSNSTVGKPCQSSSDCIINAFCSIISGKTTGVCNCVTTYYFDTTTSTCLPRKTISQACGYNYECLEYRKLSCVSGTCQCDSSTRYWNSTALECQTLKVPFTICSTAWSLTECIPNSVCWNNPSSMGVHKCICGTIGNNYWWWYNPLTGVCESKKRVGTQCEYNFECLSFSYCGYPSSTSTTKVCICDTQYYTTTSGECAVKQTSLNSGCSLIDQCNLNQNNLRCISSQCRCDLIAEIYDTFQSKCVPLKTYGQTCTVTTDCVTGFTCVLPARGGTRKACLCSSTQYFDWISGTCQTLKAFNSICGSRYECVNHDTMVCMASSGGVTKRCICAPNYSYQSSTTCLLKKSMSSSCTDDIECQDHLGFVCSGSICTCPTTKRYDSVLKKCLPLRRRNQACSANSECSSGCCSCSIANACD